MRDELLTKNAFVACSQLFESLTIFLTVSPSKGKGKENTKVPPYLACFLLLDGHSPLRDGLSLKTCI